MSAVLLALRVGLAAVFVVAAVGKLSNPNRFRDALADFGMPRALRGAGVVAIPLAEAAIAIGLLVDATARYAAIGAALLLLVFCAAIASANARGARPDCNCFGQVASAPAGPRTLARNGVLLALALTVAIGGPGDSLSDVSALALVAVAVVVQGWFSWELFRQNGRLLERIRALEDADGQAPRAGGPQGLSVGAPAPEFELRGAGGGTVGLRDLLAGGHPVALAFSDHQCGACGELPALLERMRAVRRGELTIALVLRVPDADSAPVADPDAGTLLLDDDDLFSSYAILRLPSLTLLDAAGRVIAPTVAGLEAIEELLATARVDPKLEVLARP